MVVSAANDHLKPKQLELAFFFPLKFALSHSLHITLLIPSWEGCLIEIESHLFI